MDVLCIAKRVDNGEWVEGYYVCISETYHYILTGNPVVEPGKIDVEHYKVIPETVGQYTGLTDKNGVSIFEGDIVKIVDFQIGKVVFECGAFGIVVLPRIDWDYLDSEIAGITGCDNRPYFCCNDNFISLWELMWNYNQEEDVCDVIEIIGNVHDNQ